MRSTIALWRSRNSGKKIHMPSYAHNVFLIRVMPFTFVVSLVAMTLGMFHSRDFSWTSIQFYLISLVIFTAVIACFVSLVYFLMKKSDTVFFIDEEQLLVKKDGYDQIYDLNLIDRFIIVRTSGYGPGGVSVKRDLFIVNKPGDKSLLYSDDWTKTPKSAWDKVSNELIRMTGKQVLFETYFEDYDGQILEREEYYKKIENKFKKKMGF